MSLLKPFFKLIRAVTILGFMVITAMTIVQVVARYVFNSPIVWAEEFIRYVYAWVVMFAIGIGIAEGTHVSLNILFDRLGKKAQLVTFIIGQLCVDAFLITLIIYGFRITTKNASVTSAALKLPMSVPYTSIPVGAIVVMIFNITYMVDWIRHHITGNDVNNKTANK